MTKAPCAYCEGSRIPGIHIPADFDDREACRDGKVFVASCDECGTCDNDALAADRVAALTGWPVMKSFDRDDEVDPASRAEKKGTDFYRPYFTVTLREAEALHRDLRDITHG